MNETSIDVNVLARRQAAKKTLEAFAAKSTALVHISAVDAAAASRDYGEAKMAQSCEEEKSQGQCHSHWPRS